MKNFISSLDVPIIRRMDAKMIKKIIEKYDLDIEILDDDIVELKEELMDELDIDYDDNWNNDDVIQIRISPYFSTFSEIVLSEIQEKYEKISEIRFSSPMPTKDRVLQS